MRLSGFTRGRREILKLCEGLCAYHACASPELLVGCSIRADLPIVESIFLMNIRTSGIEADEVQGKVA